MTFRIIFILTFIFFSCNSKKESNKIISDELTTELVEPSNNTHIPVGNWKLTKINRPWDQEPLFPKDEIWKINKAGEVHIIRTDSLIDKIVCYYQFVPSGFSSDSIWIMKGNFKNYSVLTELEIWIDQNKMELIDQCDDCFSFEFEIMK